MNLKSQRYLKKLFPLFLITILLTLNSLLTINIVGLKLSSETGFEIQKVYSNLDLNGERLVADGQDIFKRPINQDFAYGIGTLEPRSHHSSGVKWMPGSVWMVAFFILLVLAYYFARMLEVI